MNEVDIFAVGGQPAGKFLTFKTVGDQSPQMTYTAMREGVDGFGNAQNIYVFKDAEGQVWNWGVRKTATITLERMAAIKFGDIVGLKFEESRPSKKAGMQPTKIIKIYSDPKVVDQAWLDGRGAEPVAAEPIVEVSITTIPETAQPIKANIPVAERVVRSSTVKTILELAKAKGLTNDEMSDADIDDVIAEFAGIPLSEENAQKIIIKLASYASK